MGRLVCPRWPCRLSGGGGGDRLLHPGPAKSSPGSEAAEAVALDLRGSRLWGGAGSRKGEYSRGLSVTFVERFRDRAD